MKKLLLVVAVLALWLCMIVASAATAQAGSITELGNNSYAYGTVFGTGDLYLANQFLGDGGSATNTGWTGVSIAEDMFGTLSAYHGAGTILNNSSNYTGASEGPGGTTAVSNVMNSVSVFTFGNAVGNLMSYINALANAGN